MNEPRTKRDIERTLAAWMDEQAPRRAPGRLLEESFARTMATKQARRRPWDGSILRPAERWSAGSVGRLVLVLAVALLGVALAGGFVGGGSWFTAPSTPSPTPTITASPPTPIATVSAGPSLPAPISVTPQATIAVPAAVAMVSDGKLLWLVSGTGRLVRIDPATNKVTASVALGAATDLYNGIAVNRGVAWVTDWDAQIVYKVDTTTLKVVAKIAAGTFPKGVLATETGVWVANTHSGSVTRIDPVSNKVVATVTVGPTGTSGPNWLGQGFGSIWVGIPNDQSVVRIDPTTNTVQATIPMSSDVTPCGGFAIADQAVWIPSCSTGTLMARIDPTANTMVGTVDLGGYGYGPTLINGAPWISVERIGTNPAGIFRIDQATNQIDRVLSLGTAFTGGGDMALAAGSLWVVDGANDAVIRLPLSAFGP
jgi:YVTN family beta-propeller protein